MCVLRIRLVNARRLRGGAAREIFDKSTAAAALPALQFGGYATEVTFNQQAVTFPCIGKEGGGRGFAAGKKGVTERGAREGERTSLSLR